MTLPVLHLTGTPYEQGLAHGRSLQQQISHNLQVYFKRFQQESQLEREEVLRRARLYRDAIADHSPAYYEGMRGIADGSGFDLDDITALNVRYEIIYYQSAVLAMNGKDGCTAFAVAPQISRNSHLLLGQNWDWIPWVKGAVLNTVEADGLETISFTEAGIFGGKIGVNSAGLGLAINGITSTGDDWERLTAPFHVRCYGILRSWDMESAVAVITDTPRACSANFLIAQARDQAIDIEAAPDVVNAIPWQDSCLLVHANHFVDPAGTGIEEPPYERRHFSCYRQDNLQAMIEANQPVTLTDMQGFLQDHTNRPSSICRHENPAAPPDEQYRTVTSVVMDLNERIFHITDGPPCENEFATMQLSEREAMG
jgi:isopenicillin-N N-acyltransferase-like protein